VCSFFPSILLLFVHPEKLCFFPLYHDESFFGPAHHREAVFLVKSSARSFPPFRMDSPIPAKGRIAPEVTLHVFVAFPGLPDRRVPPQRASLNRLFTCMRPGPPASNSSPRTQIVLLDDFRLPPWRRTLSVLNKLNRTIERDPVGPDPPRDSLRDDSQIFPPLPFSHRVTDLRKATDPPCLPLVFLPPPPDFPSSRVSPPLPRSPPLLRASFLRGTNLKFSRRRDRFAAPRP